jgi:hypothetical protein
MGVVEDTVTERVKGGRPGRVRAVVAALALGVMAAVVAYRLLRSDPDEAT